MEAWHDRLELIKKANRSFLIRLASIFVFNPGKRLNQVTLEKVKLLSLSKREDWFVLMYEGNRLCNCPGEIDVTCVLCF